VGIWTRVRELDDRINNGINSRRPEDLARRWWWYLVSAALSVVLAVAAFAVGIQTVALTMLVPAIAMGFMGGFYYCERLRSQGMTRGRYGPSRIPD